MTCKKIVKLRVQKKMMRKKVKWKKNRELIRDSSLWRSNFIPSVRDFIVIIGSRSVIYTFGSHFTNKRWVKGLSKICILTFLDNYSNTVCWVSKRVDWGSHHFIFLPLCYKNGSVECSHKESCWWRLSLRVQNTRKRKDIMNISHLLFADDTIVFCEAKKEHLIYLSRTLFWFEVMSGLIINLAKSEILPVGGMKEVEELVVKLGCKVESLPSTYLGLLLGAPYKSLYVWDGVKERVRMRLALWKKTIYFQRWKNHSHKEHDD